MSAPSSRQNCFFYASMNSISLVDSRVYKPVTRIPVNSSLGIITSLAYGSLLFGSSPPDSASEILVASTSRGSIQVYNMRYPLLVNLWQQSDQASITRTRLGQR